MDGGVAKGHGGCQFVESVGGGERRNGKEKSVSVTTEQMKRSRSQWHCEVRGMY